MIEVDWSEIETLTKERDDLIKSFIQREAGFRSTIEALQARVRELEEKFRDVEAECTAAIAYEPIPKQYLSHDEVPNGLRTVAHIKFSMIREYARQALRASSCSGVMEKRRFS